MQQTLGVGLDAPAALVVLVDGLRMASTYVEGETCLNQVARLAEFVDEKVEISMFYGHTEAKWKGKGRR